MKAKAKEFKFKIIPIEHGYDVVWTMAKDFKAGDYHVIEAAPVLAEIERIRKESDANARACTTAVEHLNKATEEGERLKKQLAETKKQLDDLIKAELGG